MNEQCLHQPVVMMEIPRYEYARLVRDAERLAILVKLSKSLDSYDLKKVLDVLLKADDEVDG